MEESPAWIRVLHMITEVSCGRRLLPGGEFCWNRAWLFVRKNVFARRYRQLLELDSLKSLPFHICMSRYNCEGTQNWGNVVLQWTDVEL